MSERIQIRKEIVTETEDIDIEFPVYCEVDYSGDDYESYWYYKITEGWKTIAINKTESYRSYKSTSYEIELEKDGKYIVQGACENKFIGLSKSGYEFSTKETFEEIVRELQSVLENT